VVVVPINIAAAIIARRAVRIHEPGAELARILHV